MEVFTDIQPCLLPFFTESLSTAYSRMHRRFADARCVEPQKLFTLTSARSSPRRPDEHTSSSYILYTTSNKTIMSDAVAASPKKAAPKAKKPAKKADHPPVAAMVSAAITALKDRKGSSLPAIKKYVAATYKVDIEKLAPFVRRFLKKAVADGKLTQVKGTGASGSFKLAKVEKVAKVAKKPAAKKPAAKKPAAKKSPKKVAKKVKTPKKEKKAKKPAAAKPKKPKAKKATKSPAKKAAKKPAAKKPAAKKPAAKKPAAK